MMLTIKPYAYLLLPGLVLCGFVASATDGATTSIIRWPAVAGVNYPDEPETLLATLRRFFDQAEVPEPDARLVGVIASAAPYGLAGTVSAHAFKTLKPGQYDRVVLLAPGHGPMFENCSIPAVDVFLTPLGPVALDSAAIRQLIFSPLIQAHNLRTLGGRAQDGIHDREFAIESLLPYLQERLHEFKLVPILVGDLRDPQGIVREYTIAALADTLRPILGQRTLLVVASSFTHFGSDYGNRPFTEDLEENIAHLDRLAFERLLALDLPGFRKYLEDTKNVIDGKDCIQILLKLLPGRAQARILAYDTSMNIMGDQQRSVSYAALTFHDPAEPALSARPDRVRPLVLRRPETHNVSGEPPGTEEDRAAVVPPAQPAPGGILEQRSLPYPPGQ